MEKTLTKEENIQKFKEWNETRDSSVREELIIGNMKLAQKIAICMSKKYKVDPEEWTQYAYEGLIHAVDTYNMDFGYTFSFYAAKCIMNYLNTCFTEIYAPSAKKFAYFYAKVMSFMEKNATAEDIVDQLIAEGFISPRHRNDNIKRINILMAKPIDYMDYNDNQIISNVNLFHVVEYSDISRLVSSIWNEFTPCEKQIFTLKYGLSDGVSRSYRKISRIMGLSRDIICRIERKAVRRLKKLPEWKDIKEYYSEELSFYTRENYVNEMHDEICDNCLDENYYIFYNPESLDNILESKKTFHK